MSERKDTERIIVVGNISSAERAGLQPGANVELVSSLEEAVELRKLNGPASIIIDPSFLQSSSIQVMNDQAQVCEQADHLLAESQAQAELEKRESQYRTLAENSPEVIARFDRQLRHTYVNEYGAKVYGVPKEEVIGKTNADLGMPPDKVEFWKKRFIEVLETGKQQTVDFDFDSPNLGHQYFSSIFVPEFNGEGKVESILAITRDVTELKKTEAAMRDNEQRLLLALDAAELGTWDLDLINDVATHSLRHDQIWGYEEPQPEWSFEKAIRNVVPEDRPIIEEAYARGLVTGILHHENRIIWLDGSMHWIVADGRFVYDVDGRPVRVIGVVADITERKQAEEALRESEAKFRAVFEQAAIGIGRVNFHDATWIDVNNTFCRMLGYSVEEFQATPWPQITHPDDIDLDLIPFKRMAVGELDSYSVEKRLIHKQGHHVWARLTLSLVRDPQGRPDYEIAIIEDITTNKQAEDEITKAREEAEHRSAELESFMANLADGVVIIDAQGNIVFINDKGRAVLDMPEDMVIGNWISSFKRYSLDGDELLPQETAAARALSGETVTDLRYVWNTSWKILTLSVSASPIRDHDDRITGATIVFRDAAERVEQERRREELLEREHRIADVLQKALIPPNVPTEIGNYRIAVKYQSALREAEIGGDFYDVFELGGGKIAVLIGDVAGKGLPAAIRVAAARHSIRSYAYLDPRPARVLQLANEALCKDRMDESGMLTAFLAIVDTNVGTITYASAGHEPPVMLSSDGSVYELTARGIPLSVIDTFDYSEASRRFNPGDRIVMFTDGITEARNQDIELYDKERVISYIKDNATFSADEMAGGLMESARVFAGGNLQDDAAIVVFERGART